MLKKYLRSVADHFVTFDEVEKLCNPAVSLLIAQKKEECVKKGIEFRFAGNTDLRNTCFEDYDVCTMLGNLIDNAIGASAAERGEKAIGVEVSLQAGIFIFRVSNKRAPIKAKNIKKLFNYGFTSKKDSQGHGMVLCIVKKIVRKYSGSIEVESISGRTVFTAYLPEREN